MVFWLLFFTDGNSEEQTVYVLQKVDDGEDTADAVTVIQQAEENKVTGNFDLGRDQTCIRFRTSGEFIIT